MNVNKFNNSKAYSHVKIIQLMSIQTVHSQFVVMLFSILKRVNVMLNVITDKLLY